MAAFCKDFQTGMERLHLITTYNIDVDGDVAHGQTTFECHRVALGISPFIGLVTGFYNTDYVHTDSGWKIKKRTERLLFAREERYYAEVTTQ